jgi:hypothetical protein
MKDKLEGPALIEYFFNMKKRGRLGLQAGKCMA